MNRCKKMKKLHNLWVPGIFVFAFLMIAAAAIPAWAIDTDGDGLDDNLDNCPSISNADQLDTNGDGIGDACTSFHCVTNSEEFQQTLSDAQSNNMYDIIMLEQGIYRIVENDYFGFYFSSCEVYGLRIEGGYINGCRLRVIEPTNTVLDGEGFSWVLYIDSNSFVSKSAGSITIDGITIKRGKTDFNGAGIDVITAIGNINLNNNMITDNVVGIEHRMGVGGGIHAQTIEGDIILNQNKIANNMAQGISGGGAYLFGGAPYDPSFSSVNGEYKGSIILNNNWITGNYVSEGGGGIYIQTPGTVVLLNNIIDKNMVYTFDDAAGGGALIKNPVSSLLVNNIISGNFSHGGIYSQGGGLGLISQDTTMINNTITGNSAVGNISTGGLYLSGATNFYNNIIWGNTATVSNSSDMASGEILNAYNNDIDPSKVKALFTNYGGNINAAPLFMNPENGDFHLNKNSPLRNMGSNLAPSLPGTDFEGESRIVGSVVDIGADEYNPVKASFAATPTKGIAPLTINFTDKSSDAEGTIVKWDWDFDNDGIVDSVLQNPRIVYTIAGVYSVSLAVNDSVGNTGATIEIDYIVVGDAIDSDQDGIFDVLDNCWGIYNPFQTDLDTDETGDACDSYVDLLAYAGYSTGLKSATTKESSASDVTAAMKDGKLDIGIQVALSKGKYNILSFRSNAEASELSTVVLNLFVKSLYKGLPMKARIYAYSADGAFVQSTNYMDFNLYTGWNSFDLTPLLHSMDGFGFVKFRVTSIKNWFEISEAYFDEFVDDREINVSPSKIDFGSIELGISSALNLTVSNNGIGSLKVVSVTLPSAPFSVALDGCSGITIPASSACSVTLSFTPITAGNFTDVLRVISDDADNPSVAVQLNGSATLPPSTLKGVVRDISTELPISSVFITVTDSLNTTHTTITDVNGIYTIQGLPQGSFTATFTKVGYFDRIETGVLIAGETQTLDLQMTKAPPATLKGMVTFVSTTQPLCNVSVTVTDAGLLTHTAMSNCKGEYVISDLSPGNFTAVFEKAGYNIKTLQGTLIAGQTKELNIQLTPSTPIGFILVSSQQLDFRFVGEGESMSLKLTVFNIGTGDLRIGKIQGPSAPFAISSEGCSDHVLLVSTSCSIDMTFAPTGEGAFTDVISIPSNDPEHQSLSVKLSGTGTALPLGAYFLPDTGQTSCFDGSGQPTILCPQGQDGYFILNHPSYTLNGDGTVNDNNTWLMWQGQDDNIARTWEEAVSFCENLNIGGTANWRLPSIFELMTIVNYEQTSPSIGSAAFPNTHSAGYWSSDTDGEGAKVINFSYGESSTMAKSSGNYVRCVRGGTIPEGHFSDNFDDTLTEWDTGLIWTKDFFSARTWNQALYLCNVMEVGGYTDWRLPNIKELLSKTYTDCYLGDCFAWSSTTFGQPDAAGNYQQAFVYDNVDIAPHDKSSTHMLRCVRSGWGTLKANITGIVLDAWNSNPVSSATVSVTDAQLKTLTITTDANGKYTITGVAPGVFTGTITKTGYNPYSFTGTVSPGQVLTHNAQLVPLPRPPVVGNVSVSALATDSATITWTMDQPSAVLFEYGTTASYGSSYSDPALTTEYTITLTGLRPSTTYHFRITATNGGGLSSSTGDNTFTTLTPPVQITVTPSSPVNGATITRSDIMVTGTITNNTGNETGVTVNGIVAAVYNNQFVANHVLLVDGENTITITATDAAGNTETTSLTVNAVTTGSYINLNSNIESGIVPLEMVLRIDGTFSIQESTISVTGPGDVELVESSADEYTVRMTVEGIYYFTTNATGPDDIIYQDTIGIVVMNRTELDALLKGKWEGMRTALSNQDITTVLSYYTEETRQLHNEIYTALYDYLPQLAQEMQGIQLIYAQNNTAQYRMRQDELYGGQIVTMTYYIYFALDTDGRWKIHRY